MKTFIPGYKSQGVNVTGNLYRKGGIDKGKIIGISRLAYRISY